MNVPTALIRPYIAAYLDIPEGASLQNTNIRALAEKTSLHYDTLERLWMGRHETTAFWVADRILCATNSVQAWYREGSPLADIYRQHSFTDSPPLPKGKCARVGCSNVLPEKTWGGGQPMKYCSKVCRNAASRRRWRERRFIRCYSNHFDRCKRGHDWDEENTYISPHGKRLCRACMRIHAKETRRRKKLKLQTQARIERAA